jgi:hypothetical protein
LEVFPENGSVANGSVACPILSVLLATRSSSLFRSESCFETSKRCLSNFACPNLAVCLAAWPSGLFRSESCV